MVRSLSSQTEVESNSILDSIQGGGYVHRQPDARLQHTLSLLVGCTLETRD
jgi:hypothetical protein